MINITPEKMTEPASDDSEVVLSVEAVSKKFCRDLKRSLFYGVQDIASDLTGMSKQGDRLRTKEFWALDNVSFQLKKGEALGLVGKNGSGKSTLLRIIAGLIKPDLGTVKVTGRVAPLIALGAGFNPILTGRENIYANMSILGLSTKEIDERFDDVVEFAEIGDAIDSPVQTYSSGMAARLGFASAIHTEPDILLIDEVLAVGDVRFRGKCHRKLHDLRAKGTSFILVSHGTYTILSVCDRSVYLQKGQLIVSGDTKLVINQYEKDLFVQNTLKTTGSITIPEKSKSESLGLDITSIYFKSEYGKKIESLKTGKKATICITCKSHANYTKVGVVLVIKSLKTGGENALILNSFQDDICFELSSSERKELQVHLPYLCLQDGIYSMNIFVKNNSLYTLDSVESFVFAVDNDNLSNSSLFDQPREWRNKIIDN